MPSREQSGDLARAPDCPPTSAWLASCWCLATFLRVLAAPPACMRLPFYWHFPACGRAPACSRMGVWSPSHGARLSLPQASPLPRTAVPVLVGGRFQRHPWAPSHSPVHAGIPAPHWLRGAYRRAASRSFKREPLRGRLMRAICPGAVRSSSSARSSSPSAGLPGAGEIRSRSPRRGRPRSARPSRGPVPGGSSRGHGSGC